MKVRGGDDIVVVEKPAPNKRATKATKEKDDKSLGKPKIRASSKVMDKAVHLVGIRPKHNATEVAKDLNLELRNLQRWYPTWKKRS
jgi:hypothetical protein